MIAWLALAAITGGLVGAVVTRSVSSPSRVSISADVAGTSQVEDRRIAEAVRSLPVGLVLADEDGTVIYRNGYADSFERGPRVSKALVRGHVGDLLTAAMAGEQSQMEIDLFGPPRLRLRFSGRPIIDNGHQVGSSVMISDVTEEHRIDKVRRDFVANLSHELKTPVGAMSILAETLSESTDAETVTRLAGRIQKAALRLGDTVDDLLTLSTIEAGETVGFERLAVSDLASSALDACRDEALIRKIQLVEPASHAVVIEVLGDRPQLVSAPSNLITNAIKYSDDGGEVSVGLIEESDWVEISVVDHGIGIPGPDLQRIFERFYRVDTARSRSTGGTGLGLSIVRHVALNHGGEVTVKSEEGKGSVFTIRLPIAGSDS